MVDERSFEGMLHEIWKVLGRVEEKVDDVKVTARQNSIDRDHQLDAIKDRQVKDAHQAANVQQKMVAQIEGLARDVRNVSNKVDGQDKRLSALEAPIKKAAAAKTQRNVSAAKLAAIAGTVISLIWVALTPIWNVLGDWIAHKMISRLPPL